MLIAVLYWYVWIKLIPSVAGYRIEEEADVLEDGTTINSLVKVRNKEADDQPSLRRRLRSLWGAGRKHNLGLEQFVGEETDAFIGQDASNDDEESTV
jgi:hypothetical protein